MTLAARVLARFKRAGGSSFAVYIGNPDVKAAFRQAVDDAQYEKGSGGYSGTIAEKSGYDIRHDMPMTREQAREFARKDGERNEKWGPAYAVPVGETAKTVEKKFKVVVQARDQWATQEAATKAVKEKFAPLIQGGEHPTLKFDKTTLVKEGKLPEMTVEKGGPEGYRVRAGVPTFYGDRGPDFASRAEALAAIKESLRSDKPEPGRKYEIIKFKTTDTFTVGDTSKTLHSYEVEGTATFAKPTGKIIGWFFYGVASS